MDLVLLLLLIVLNALFAMSEMAVVSSRKARLQRMADDGYPGAAAAQRLNEEPSGVCPLYNSAASGQYKG